MRQSVKFCALILASVMAVSGCGLVNSAIEETVGSKTTGGETTSLGSESKGGSESENKTIKINAYVDMSNDTTDAIFDVLDHYVSEFGDEIGKYKPEKKGFSFTLYGLSQSTFEKTAKAAAVVNTKPAIDELDPTVMPYVESIEPLWRVLEEAAEYYEQKNYVDDDFAKGADLHDRIWQAYSVFSPNCEAFEGALSTYLAKQKYVWLDEYRAEGKVIRAAMLNYLICAQEVSAEMKKQEISSSTLMNLDLDAFSVPYDALVKALEDLRAVDVSESNLKAEGVEKYNFDSFLSEATDLKAAASGMIQRVKEKDEVSDIHFDNYSILTMLSGTPESFYSKLSTLVDDYNRT